MEHPDDAVVLVDLVNQPVGPAPGAPSADLLSPEWFAHPVGIAPQGPEGELHDRGGCLAWQPSKSLFSAGGHSELEKLVVIAHVPSSAQVAPGQFLCPDPIAGVDLGSGIVESTGQTRGSQDIEGILYRGEVIDRQDHRFRPSVTGHDDPLVGPGYLIQDGRKPRLDFG